MRYRGVGRWPCAAAHMLNRVTMNTIKSEQQQQQQQCLLTSKGLEGQCEVQPNTSEGNEKKRNQED